MDTQLLQLLLSFIAILLLALLAKIYWPKDWKLDKDRVLRAFGRSDYNVNIREIWLDASNTAALAQLDDDTSIGYAFAFGDRVTCRTLAAEDIKSIKRKDNHLDIRFRDFTLNTVTFDFLDDAACTKTLESLPILNPENKVQT